MTAQGDPSPQAASQAARSVSIGGKLALGTSLVLALVTAAIYVGLSRFEHEKLIAAKEQAARMAGALFVRFAATPVLFDDETGIRDTTALLAQDPEVLGVELWRVKAEAAGAQLGERLAAQFKGPGRGREGMSGAAPRPVHAPEIERRADRLILRDAIRDQDGKIIAVVAVQYTLAREHRAFIDLRRRILLASAAIYVLVAALLWGLGRRWITGPLQRLFRAVQKVEAGERVDLGLGPDLAPAGARAGDEIGRLAGAFARMAGAVDRRERDIVRRNDDMKLILDNIAQGLLQVTRQGALLPEHSAVLETWFGPLTPGEALWDYLGRRAPRAGAWIGALWGGVSEDLFPIEVALGQMPARVQVGERTCGLSFRPISSGHRGEEPTILVVISDVTIEVEQEQARIGQQELVSLFQWMVKDRAGLLDFLADADRLVLSITGPGTGAGEDMDLTLLKREVHTLKGNCGIFGLSGVVSVCQDIEARFEEGEESLRPQDREALLSAWARVNERRRQLLPEERQGRIEIDPAEHSALLTALYRGAPRAEIARQVRRWTLEPVRQRLARIGEQARALAQRLGRGEIAVSIEAGDVRLPDGALGEFWASFAHLVRNAVDHGLEPPEERQRAGKSPSGTLHLRASLRSERFLIEIEDDGRGIDWGKLRERARAAGLPAGTRGDLVEALFADGISTREAATEISGRGVGMSAVRAACEASGGRVRVDSEPGQGTRFQFSWPAGVLSIPPLSLSLAAPAPAYRSSQATSEDDCAEQ